MKSVDNSAKDLRLGLTEEVSRFEEAWKIFKKNRMALSGLFIFVLFFVVAVSGLILTTGDNPVLDPAKVRLSEKLLRPFSPVNKEMIKAEDRPVFGVYLLGTDDLGRDVFARMMQGAWVSLTVGFVAVGISVMIGIVLGGISGYYGTVRIKFITVDTLIMRFVDIMLCFPAFFLILTVVAILPASIYNIMIVIGLTSWMGTTRFVRAEFLSLREQDFVSAAKAMGISDLSIIFRHMMPNAVAPVIVSAIIGVASAIYTEAALSFLGFGVPPPHATWGNIFSDGKEYLFDAPWLIYIPGLTILFVVLAFNLFGEGLRDALNPKLRKR
jgi:peptide/nickel transport system permease protein